MIEALVALGLAVVIISAIANIVITSLNNTTYSKNQNLATVHAQEGIETVRKLVNQSYTEFKRVYTGSSYCLDENDNLLLSSGSCNAVKTGIFIREVGFEHESADCQGNLEARIKVSWSDNRCRDSSNLYCHNIELSSCFVDINEVQQPL